MRPSLPTFDTSTCRELDRIAIEEIGIPGIVLMEHAALGSATLALDLLTEKRVPISEARIRVTCGPGNNGGDGYATARLLHNAGAVVTVCELFEPQADRVSDATRNRDAARRMGLEPVAFDASDAGFDLEIDAIFGTGLGRPPEGPALTAIEALNAGVAPILALDVPSGLDGDTGLPVGVAVRATATITFGLPKQGFDPPSASEYVGRRFLQPIGVPVGRLPTGVPAFARCPIEY